MKYSLIPHCFRLSILFVVASTFAIATTDQATGAASKPSLGVFDTPAGIQFVDRSMKSIPELVSSSKVIGGEFSFQQKEGRFAVGVLQYPFSNSTPEGFYQSGKLKIRDNVPEIDPADFQGVLMLKELGKGEYEIIGYSTEEPVDERMYLKMTPSTYEKFRKSLFDDKKYRYRHLYSDAIKLLRRGAVDDGLTVLASLGPDAAEAIEDVKKFTEHDDIYIILAALNTLERIDESAAKEAYRSTQPKMTKLLESKDDAEVLTSLRILMRSGTEAKAAYENCWKLVTNPKPRDNSKAIVFTALRCLAAIAPESKELRTVLIDRANSPETSTRVHAETLLKELDK